LTGKDQAKADIYNQLGQKVLSLELESLTHINTSALSNGMYTIEVRTDERTVRAKFNVLH
jgi:hypothetical protein